MKKIIFGIIGLISINNIYSQNGGIGNPISNNINTPVSFPLSAEAYSHLKFDINPVNLNTGIPDITETLYTFSVDDYIKLGIDLKYHPSGLRVKEVSGWVGQGWNTFSPGVITRETNGLPDEKLIYGILNNGFINALNTYGLSAPQTTKYLYDSKIGKEDVEYDIFHFSFLNHSGSFKLNTNGSAEYIGTSGNYKIHFEKNNDVLKFTITDDRGYRYIFDKKTSGYDSTTLERILNYEHSCSGPISTMVSNELNPSSTWYLSEIKNPQGTLICSFSYDASAEQPIPTVTENFNVRLGGTVHDVMGLNGAGECGDGTLFCNHKSLLPLNERTVIQNGAGLLLTKITIPNKGSIDYEISNHRLESISIKNAYHSLIKKINFNYLTFALTGRHFLNQITIKDRSDSQMYIYGFEYNNPGMFPEKTSEVSDFWGYYNGRTNSDLIIRAHDIITDNKRTDKEAVKTGILTKIHLPTGGYKEFEFESNTYSKELANTDMIFDEQENRDYTGHNVTKTIFNASQPLPNGIIYIPNSQEVNISFSATQYQRPADVPSLAISLIPIKLNPSNPALITQAEIDNAEEENENNTYLARPSMFLHINSGSNTNNSFYTKGYYRIVYTANTGGVLQWYPVNYSLNINYYNLINNIQYNYGGGLRIKKIAVSDGTDLYHKNYDYHAIPNNNPNSNIGLASNISSGEIINTPIYKKTHSYNYLSVATVNQLTGPDGYATSQNYLSASNLGYSSVNAIKGSFVNYKSVSVTDGKGRVENIFSVYSDYPDISFASVFSPSYKFRQQDYKVGLLLKDRIYSVNNDLLKETDYEYDIRDYSKDLLYKVIDNNGGCYLQNGPYSHRVKDYDAFISSQNSIPHPSTECGHPLSNTVMLGSEIKYGFGGLKKITETETLNGIYVQKSTTNLYNTTYNISSSTSALSSGENYETTYSYAHEKGNTKLINANMTGIPLETEMKKNTKTISRTEIKYDDASNLFPTAVLSYDLKNASSVDVTYDQYDAKGNILQYTTKDGIPTAVVWGYNSTQPIAKITGLPYSVISSFTNDIITASDADAANPSNEETLIDLLDVFRKNSAFENAQVSTFTYDPLIGVTSITSPSGIREVYLYDFANRLKEIRENNSSGKVIKEFKYNYKH